MESEVKDFNTAYTTIHKQLDDYYDTDGVYAYEHESGKGLGDSAKRKIQKLKIALHKSVKSEHQKLTKAANNLNTLSVEMGDKFNVLKQKKRNYEKVDATKYKRQSTAYSKIHKAAVDASIEAVTFGTTLQEKFGIAVY